jgi:peptidyl-prolyl cis-trans isomerase B (cyclophilin B)
MRWTQKTPPAPGRGRYVLDICFHRATSQFFINTVDNASLDHSGDDPQGFGYAVFGKVTAGMDVVDKIEASATGNKGPYQNVPLEPVVIRSVKLK